MLTVKTFLAPSPIHGIGLFAKEPIQKGQIVWRWHPVFDHRFTDEDASTLWDSSQVYSYAWRDASEGCWFMVGDDARFINHSETPNLLCYLDDFVVAARDIEAGEELTENYREFHDGEEPYYKPIGQ